MDCRFILWTSSDFRKHEPPEWAVAGSILALARELMLGYFCVGERHSISSF
jgi:hypothetical protein